MEIDSLLGFFSQFSPDAPCSTEREKRESGHHNGVRNREAQQPPSWTMLPLPPGRQHTIGGENGEKCSHGFVKELARHAPERAKRDDGGTPKSREQIGRHLTILVPFSIAAKTFLTNSAQLGGASKEVAIDGPAIQHLYFLRWFQRRKF
jgi:hypothetical protein